LCKQEAVILEYDYGYGELGNKIIELFCSGAPDFDAAEKLIEQGADLNAAGTDDDENILSEILEGYWWSEKGDSFDDDCDDCEDTHCDHCEHNRNLNPNLGSSMCAIIRFFLDHGFDVTKCDDCFGAQCLRALTFSAFDRHMIEATKILFDAGAKNRPTSPTSTNRFEEPWSYISTERSYQKTCECNYATANIYEAVYQIYQAIEDGRPYSGIDSYEIAVGKKILKVLAESNGEQSVFYPQSLPGFQAQNCFNKNLYFVYEGGALVATEYADFWTDTVLPDVELVDVSEHFQDVVGSTITQITFDHKEIQKGSTVYGQPITTLELDSGRKIRFSINFGEVKKEQRAAFYDII
jgi:hypothetical protein